MRASVVVVGAGMDDEVSEAMTKRGHTVTSLKVYKRHVNPRTLEASMREYRAFPGYLFVHLPLEFQLTQYEGLLGYVRTTEGVPATVAVADLISLQKDLDVSRNAVIGVNVEDLWQYHVGAVIMPAKLARRLGAEVSGSMVWEQTNVYRKVTGDEAVEGPELLKCFGKELKSLLKTEGA